MQTNEYYESSTVKRLILIKIFKTEKQFSLKQSENKSAKNKILFTLTFTID